MRYGGRTDVRTHDKIVPPYTLVWGSLRLAPITQCNVKPYSLHVHVHSNKHSCMHTARPTHTPQRLLGMEATVKEERGGKLNTQHS